LNCLCIISNCWSNVFNSDNTSLSKVTLSAKTEPVKTKFKNTPKKLPINPIKDKFVECTQQVLKGQINNKENSSLNFGITVNLNGIS
jgi:hypothetical protein